MEKGWVRKLWGHPTETQIQLLKTFGLKEREIYVEGRGAEDFEALLRSLHPGDDFLHVAADLRVFGDSRKEILGKTEQLEKRTVRVLDVRDENASFSVLMDRGLAELGKYARFRGRTGKAKQIGRAGGEGKAVAAKKKRDDIMREDIVRRLCAHPKLTWQDCEDILGGKPFTVASLRRHYGPKT